MFCNNASFCIDLFPGHQHLGKDGTSVKQAPNADKQTYIEYRPGTLNMILSVPHGGQQKPKTIPNRDCGSRVNGDIYYDHRYPKAADIPVKTKSDLRTVDLATALSDALRVLIGRRPHIVINHLHRIKLDCNCDVEEATFGVPEAVDAWHEFHNAIETAMIAYSERSCLLLDLHGHSHAEEWIELGYGVREELLDNGRFLPWGYISPTSARET